MHVLLFIVVTNGSRASHTNTIFFFTISIVSTVISLDEFLIIYYFIPSAVCDGYAFATSKAMN